MAVATIHVRVKPEVKEGSEKILEKIGITMSDFVNMSLKRLIFEERIPFSTRISDSRIPENMRVENKEHMIRLIKEAIDEDDGRYYTFDEIFEELGIPKE